MLTAVMLLMGMTMVAGSARALNAVGWYSTQVGDYEEALRCCAQALSLSGEYSDPINEAGTWDTMGYAHHRLGRPAEAIRCFRTALGICEGLRARYYATPILLHLGDACQAAGQPDDARHAWQDALAILDGLQHPDAERARARLSGSSRQA